MYVVAEGIDKNQEALDWFIDSLPLDAFQGHAMVSGELLYVMNLVMKTEPPVKYHRLATEDLSKQDIGRVSFFATAGRIGSIMLKYGQVTESMHYPTVAQVRRDHLPRLKQVGRAVWDSIFITKNPLKVVFKRAEVEE
ncbi:MAG: hypothetical protein QXU44_04940 [Candidatus Caldarchaeum sp.]